MWRQTFRFVELPLVLFLFAVVNLALLASSGIRVGGDSGIYIDGARAMLEGHALTKRQPSYIGYIAFVAFFETTGAGLAGVVIAQVMAATLAAFAVCRIAVELGGRLAGLLAVLLFAVDVDTNRWHSFVLADSLYLSVLTIAVWLVHRARTFGPYVSASLALLVAASIRPEGWFVIPAAAIYWILRGPLTPSRRAAGLAAVLLGCALLTGAIAPRLGGNVKAVGPGEMLRQGQTIWEYEGWRLSMPVDPSSPGEGSARAAVSYARRHPISTIALMLARVGVHVVRVRPYFSAAHNAAIGLWLLPLYGFGILGVWQHRRQALAGWCVVAIATQTLVVALTHADWDGRYLAHMLPLVYPFTACGLALWLRRMTPGLTTRPAPG